MKLYLLFITLTISFLNLHSQKLVEITSNNTTNKFPVFKYENLPNIEEKVNYFLQMKYLLHLPGKFKNDPFEKLSDKDLVKNNYHFKSWKQQKLNKNILSVQLNGTLNKKPFKYLEHFDLRTGDFFILNDLFNEEGQQNLRKEITTKIKELVDQKKVPSLKHNVSLSYQLLENELVIVFTKIKDEKLILSYSSLRPFLSAYAINLLFPSEKIIRRPDMANKLLKGEGIINKGKKYERKLNYSILIFGIKEDGTATIYRWKDSLKNTEKYIEASINENVIQADDIIWDDRANKKIHLMYSLHLEKLSDGIWNGKLQLGSPIYPLVFKEY